jgi:Putative binding domain, N-terminal
MTTHATPSSTAHVVRRVRLRACSLAVPLALAMPLAGCDLFHADFPIAVGNRTANTVSLLANGGRIGEVGSNLTATFSLEASVTGSAGSATSPTAVAQVTFSARDLTTGVLSAGTTTTLLKDVTTYVDVAPCVPIGGGLAPLCVSVSSTQTGSSAGLPAPACTFSLSGSNQSIPTTGGAGNVTVTTSSGCTWSATSSASWIVVVSGATGTGPGVVAFQVAPNTTGQARTASLSIGGQTFTINQSA